MNDTHDQDFREPYVDVDEWRDTPVRHRYVHGGFADNGTRFSIYFPPDDAGEEVSLCAVGEVPPCAEKVVAVQWDLDGDGTFPATEDVKPAERVRVERRHAFSSPGTHFVTVRVRSERDGDPSALFTRVDTIARLRVVVAGTDNPVGDRTR